jgi:hypothetical protein
MTKYLVTFYAAVIALAVIISYNFDGQQGFGGVDQLTNAELGAANLN